MGKFGIHGQTNLDDVKAHEMEEGVCIHPASTWENGILQGHCLEIGCRCYVLYVASLIGNSQYDEKKRTNGFDTGVGGLLAGALKVRARGSKDELIPYCKYMLCLVVAILSTFNKPFLLRNPGGLIRSLFHIFDTDPFC